MSFRILIIDDDEDIQLILASVLRPVPQLSIDKATNGAEALKKLGGAAFDGVILDYLLPDASGEEILEQISTLAAIDRPRVVMLSARDDRVLHDKWRQLGALKVFQKPFNPFELLPALKECLEF